MRITSITLQGYRPLLHNSIETITIEFPSPLTLIIGDNGSGKSSVLRELSPLPAVSSDYEKNGIKQIIIEHDKFVYELLSDFSNTRHTHSFKRNGEELNESGNSGLQQELCVTEFGYTSTVDALTKFQYLLTNMTRTQRKSLFFELYPDDISFLLDEHKHVCSSIRKYRNNLAMLDEMKNDVTDNLISADRKQNLEDRKQTLNGQNAQVDAALFRVNRELDEIRQHPNYRYTGETLSLDELSDEMEQITRAILLERTYSPQCFESASLDTQLAVLTADIATKTQQQQNLSVSAQELHEQLAEYEAAKNTNTEDEIARYETISASMAKLISDLSVDAQVPILGTEQLTRYTEHTLPKVTELLNYVVECNGNIMTAEELAKLKNRISDLQDFASKHRVLESEMTVELERYNKELEKRRESSPPSDCRITCQLKSEHINWIDRFQKEVARRKENIAKLQQDTKQKEDEITTLQKKIAGPLAAQQYVDELLRIFSWESWSEFLMQGASAFVVLKERPTTLFAGLSRIQKNSENAIKIAKYKAEKQHADERLEVLYKLRKSANEFIHKTAVEKTVMLKNTVSEITNIEYQLDRLSRQLDVVTTLSGYKARLMNVKQTFCEYSTHRMLIGAEEYNTCLLHTLTDEKHRITDEMVEIENIMNKQNELAVRLKESIEPRINATVKALNHAQLIEPSLSPNGGLPSKYIIQFINNLLTAMNSIIHNIWGYGLEMQYLDENGGLDFSLPVIINEGTTIPDCSMCSAGEKEILNLTATIALCRILELSELYPIRMDEPDSALSHGNRNRLTTMISEMLENGHVMQLFLIDHFHALFNAFKDTEIVCLKPDNVILPETYNTFTTMR